jgi:hypothetical protein
MVSGSRGSFYRTVIRVSDRGKEKEREGRERERERGGKSHSMLTPVEVGRAIVIVTVKPVPAPHNPLFQWPLIVIAIA